MTNRSRFLILLGLAGLFAGIVRGQASLSLFSLSVFLWILFDWIQFQAVVRFQLPHVKFTRTVNGNANSSGTLWVGRRVHVDVRAETKWKLACPVLLRDVVPENLELCTAVNVAGAESRTELLQGQEPNGPSESSKISRVVRWLGLSVGKSASPWGANELLQLAPSREIEFSYVARVRGAGKVVLPGIRVVLEDRRGFFRQVKFIPVEQSFRALPDYFQSAETRPTVKRHNSLPSHGIHRLQRSGTGAELLELREYVPGDPPKSIAWKASARRENLMTRQYESEVPVRVRFFVDGGTSSRLGGFGKRLLDQMNFVAASVAKAATSIGDPVSGTLIDETEVKQLSWFNGDFGLLQFLSALAEFTARPLSTEALLSPSMIRAAQAICFERYPELLDRRYHSLPFTIFSSTRDRIQLAAVLAEVSNLTPREQVECTIDDRQLATQLQRFLFDSGLPWLGQPGEFVSSGSRDDSDKRPVEITQALSDSLSAAIARARDNEVFVLFVEPTMVVNRLERLLPVIKLAIAKHHRVAVVCPTSTFLRPSKQSLRSASKQVEDLLWVGEQARMRDLLEQLQRSLVRLGASVTFSGERSAIRLVLAEMDMARDGKRSVTGGRA